LRNGRFFGRTLIPTRFELNRVDDAASPATVKLVIQPPLKLGFLLGVGIACREE
jgi:hypothetical protein